MDEPGCDWASSVSAASAPSTRGRCCRSTRSNPSPSPISMPDAPRRLATELRRDVGTHSGGARRGRHRRARDRRPDSGARAAAARSRPRQVCRRSARSRSRSTSPTLDAVIAETSAQGSSSRSASSAASTPATARRARPSRRARSATLLVAARRDPRSGPPPEAYIAASGGIFRDLHIHDFDAIRFVTGREIVEVYADGAVRADAMVRSTTATSTPPPPCSGSTAARSRSSPARGTTRSATTCGSRCSAPATASPSGSTTAARYRSVEPGVPAEQAGLRELHRAVRGRLPRRARDVRRRVRDGGASPCTLAGRPRRARRRGRRRPLARRAAARRDRARWRATP